jgi:hypothetical protein
MGLIILTKNRKTKKPASLDLVVQVIQMSVPVRLFKNGVPIMQPPVFSNGTYTSTTSSFLLFGNIST